jgi:hypothetical protein
VPTRLAAPLLDQARNWAALLALWRLWWSSRTKLPGSIGRRAGGCRSLSTAGRRQGATQRDCWASSWVDLAARALLDSCGAPTSAEAVPLCVHCVECALGVSRVRWLWGIAAVCAATAHSKLQRPFEAVAARSTATATVPSDTGMVVHRFAFIPSVCLRAARHAVTVAAASYRVAYGNRTGRRTASPPFGRRG